MLEDAPRVFETYVGGFRGQSFGAWWDGTVVVYESFGPAWADREQVIVSPSKAQWLRFWRTIDRLDIWQWERGSESGERFEPGSVIHDGTHWSLTLGHGDRLIECYGSDLDERRAFTSFAEAVSRLLGGCEFG
jgi:hypothetical protein